MKNSTLNPKISVAIKNFLWDILVTTYQPTFVAYLNQKAPFLKMAGSSQGESHRSFKQALAQRFDVRGL